MLTRSEFAGVLSSAIFAVAGYKIEPHEFEASEGKKLPELGIDSLTVVSLLAELESRLHMRFVMDDVDENTFASVASLFNYLYQKVR